MLAKRTCGSLIAALICLASAPAAGGAADAVAPPSSLTLSVAHAIGAEAVIVSGTSATARTLEATLYATFSRDLPTVLLARRAVTVDADGTFRVTIPTAPAYFRDAIVTVVVRAPSDKTFATARVSITAPNIDTPADANPR